MKFYYAPLAGCTDFPFRQMLARWNPGLMFCEMIKMDPLVRREPTTLRMLDYDETMHPIGAQVCGSKIELAAESARMIEDMGFDVLDFNCGCPVDKVTKDGSGSGMLKNPELIGDILAEMVAAVKIPVTVKIRAGWDENSIVAPQITQIAEAAGAKSIAIHGRTRVQGYRGFADWNVIKEAKEVAKTIEVIGNGDVFDPEAAMRMKEQTNCDVILISRGMLGQPWIVDDMRRFFEGKEPIVRGIDERRKELHEHFQLIKKYHSEQRRILIEMRKVGCWYIKKTPRTKEFRHAISRAENLDQVEDLILNFQFEMATC